MKKHVKFMACSASALFAAALGLTGLVKARALLLFGGAAELAKTWGDLVREDAKTDPRLAKAIQAAEGGFTDAGRRTVPPYLPGP